MPCASNITLESRFMALFIGPKNCGKTAAACSWMSPEPSTKRVKVIDVDGGMSGLLNAPWVDRSRIDYDYFAPKDNVKEEPFYIRVNNALEYLHAEVKKGSSPYETLIIDSATFFARNLIKDSIPFTHGQGKGNKIGIMNVAGPSDFNFEVTGMSDLTAWLKSLPLNIIVTAHVEDKWDKPKDPETGERMVYADNVIVGEKLSLRPKVDTALAGVFKHMYRFDRKVISNQEKFFVEYVSDIAFTAFPGFKPGRHDITGQNFRKYTLDLVSRTQGTNVVQLKA